ncbi:zinc ribbon domain-containing protein [Streptomyces sp. NBC_00019]|uniref:zinc ribbon domain-containing protein n=1 Tax=Streptomyces sp. NBC_00019 TaxID=2975623 RepID=UPI00386B83AE
MRLPLHGRSQHRGHLAGELGHADDLAVSPGLPHPADERRDALVPPPLHIREWTCAACGAVHDRDHNAAKNVKTAAGLAVEACGAQVRPGRVLAQRSEAGSHGFSPDPRAA